MTDSYRNVEKALPRWLTGLAALTVAMGLALPAGAGESTWLAAVEADAAPAAAPAEVEGSANPYPVTLGVEYTVVSDYIWRGANFSEYAGEGRERLNHQVDVSLSADLADLGIGDFGSITFDAWFEIYEGQRAMAPGSETSLQEVDYTLSWAYAIPETPVSVELGWIAYTFPNTGGDGYSSYEVYGAVAFNDGALFGQEDGVLNPSIAYNYDYDLVEAGVLTLAVEHEFAISDLTDAPVLKDMTITPSATVVIDNRFWDKAIGGTGHTSTRVGFVDYGLAAGMDLNSVLDIPAKYGAFSLGAFVNYSDALRDDLLNDEFYGGMTIGLEW